MESTGDAKPQAPQPNVDSSSLQSSSQLSPQWKIFDQLLDAVFIVDRTGKMYYANESFRHLADIPNRAIASHEEANLYIELPQECWDFDQASDDQNQGGYREVGFLAKNGVMGRAQVFTCKIRLPELSPEDLFYLVIRDVTVEARLHAKYKVQIENNERLIVDLQRGITEASFLRKLATELPIYSETSALLESITDRIRKELGFREAHFFKLNKSDQGVEAIGLEQRLGSRMREVAVALEAALKREENPVLESGALATSFMLQPFGMFWVTKVMPRLESSFVLVTSPKPNFEHVDHMAFLETLSGQLATLLDNRSLYYASITDPLTALFNRRFFDSRLGIECMRAKEKRIPLSLMLIDIDHFKTVNDTHGHQAGDAVLMMLSNVIKRRIRGSDVSARVGGEEFAVLLPDTNANDAIIVAESLMQILEKTDLALPQTSSSIKISISCGIAGFSWTTDTPESLYKAADEALYRAKEQGRNRFIVADRTTA